MSRTFLLALIVGLIITESGSANADGGGLTTSPAAQQKIARVQAGIDKGLGWLAQHMQWDFDDVDPSMPLSPFWRFDHVITSKYLLPSGHDTIRFSTTVRPTGRRGWVTTTVNPFAWLQVQGTVFSQGLKKPLTGAASTEVMLPLDTVTLRADDVINRSLDVVQQGMFGRTVAGSMRTHVLVGAGTHEKPWAAVEANTQLLLSQHSRPLRLRTRIVCNRDMQVYIKDNCCTFCSTCNVGTRSHTVACCPWYCRIQRTLTKRWDGCSCR